MTTSPSYLAGGMATHARGQTLAATFAATPCDTLPASGALFVMGKDLQAGDEDSRAWLDWVATAGRLLVVVPPFGSESCELPVRWEARRTEPLAGGETDLGKLLARERRYEIRGQLLPFERTAGQVVTAGWRKHPAAGLVAITALPVWSLSALDHKTSCRSWLAELLNKAGKPMEADEGRAELTTGAPERVPTSEEWALLLHLCTGPFDGDQAAVDALAGSTIHQLPAGRAPVALRALAEMGLARAGALTAEGERALLDSPYAAYARALRRQA